MPSKVARVAPGTMWYCPFCGCLLEGYVTVQEANGVSRRYLVCMPQQMHTGRLSFLPCGRLVRMTRRPLR